MSGFRPILGCLFALATLLSATTLPGEEPPADVAKLQADFELSLADRDYAAALTLAEKRTEITEPLHTDALYDIARARCLLGQKDEAYKTLQQAADAGFWDSFRLRKDEAFAKIREEEPFKALVRKIWARGYIAMLERPEREEFQKPDEVMRALALRPGERVADLGAGSGYFTVRVARAVAPTGTVWALDVAQEMLDYLAQRLQKENLANVRLAKVAKDDPQLPPASVDTILMVDTLHYVQNRPEYAKKLRAGLAPGGRVVIIDYIPRPFEERPWGPPPEQQMSKESVDTDLAAAGLVPVTVHDFLPEQYFVEYRVKPAEAPVESR